MRELTTGQLAERGGVGVETVRFYEREGLIEEPPRAPSGYRRYPPEAVTRLRFIRRAQELGFSLKEIKELLALRLDPRSTCGDVRDRAEEKLADIRDKIVSLERMRAALERLTAACSGQGSVSECPILEAIDQDEKEQEMSDRRQIEVFSAGCPPCDATVQLVQQMACPSCAVTVRDMHDPEVAGRANELGIRAVPAVVIDGVPADCCAGRGPDEALLRQAGVGVPLD